MLCTKNNMQHAIISKKSRHFIFPKQSLNSKWDSLELKSNGWKSLYTLFLNNIQKV